MPEDPTAEEMRAWEVELAQLWQEDLERELWILRVKRHVEAVTLNSSLP